MPLTSNNIPQPRKPSSTVDPFPGIEARPLNMPDFVNVKPKNPLLAFRWINRAAGEGQRMDQMVFAGFRPVKPDECLIPDPAHTGKLGPIPPSMIKDGAVIYGDLILMAIDKKIYDGALKHNWSRAVQRMAPGADKKVGQEAINKTLNEVGAAARQVPELTRKLQVYTPSQQELDKADSSGKVP